MGFSRSVHVCGENRSPPHVEKTDMSLPSYYACWIFSNAEVIVGWRNRGKNKKASSNFGYTTLLPDNIPQSINI